MKTLLLDMMNLLLDVKSLLLDVRSLLLDMRNLLLDVKSLLLDMRGLLLDARNLLLDVRSLLLDVKNLFLMVSLSRRDTASGRCEGACSPWHRPPGQVSRPKSLLAVVETLTCTAPNAVRCQCRYAQGDTFRVRQATFRKP